MARLAGVPREVVERAKQILAQLEQEHLDERGRPKLGRRRRAAQVGDLQLTLFAAAEHPLLAEIRSLDVNQLRPVDALALVSGWQTMLAGGMTKDEGRNVERNQKLE